MALEVTDGNIEETLGTSELVILDFWAEWCGPCRMMGPIIDELSEANEDVVIGKVNVDSNPESAAKYGIRSIPSILFIKDGEVIDTMTGTKPKAALQEKVDELK
jgi:thioredoxin 1